MLDIDSNEEARAAGEKASEAWWPIYRRWAENHANDVELLACAAFMDGFRAAFKAMQRTEDGAIRRYLKAPAYEYTGARRGPKSREEKRLAALALADLGQDLGR